jgi:hypothetical protein
LQWILQPYCMQQHRFFLLCAKIILWPNDVWKQNTPCCTMFDWCQTTVPENKNCIHLSKNLECIICHIMCIYRQNTWQEIKCKQTEHCMIGPLFNSCYKANRRNKCPGHEQVSKNWNLQNLTDSQICVLIKYSVD